MQDNHFSEDDHIGPAENGVLLPLRVAEEIPKAGDPNRSGERMREQRLLPDVLPGRNNGVFGADDRTQESDRGPAIANFPEKTEKKKKNLNDAGLPEPLTSRVV